MRKIWLLLLLLLSYNINAQKGDLYNCIWREGQYDISAIPAEKFLCNKKGKICYYISNDKDNIVLNLLISDVLVQNRILKEGLTIWISMDGKQARKMGVRYPLGSERSPGKRRNPMELAETNPDGSMVTPLSMANSIELIGFTGESERRLPSENADSFNGFVRYDKSGALLYRLVMPVTKIPIRNSRESDGPMPFIIGLEYGSSVSAASDQRGSAPPPPSSAGGRSGRGGGRGGGMAGGSGQVRNTSISIPESKPPVIFWIKNVKLATGR